MFNKRTVPIINSALLYHFKNSLLSHSISFEIYLKIFESCASRRAKERIWRMDRRGRQISIGGKGEQKKETHKEEIFALQAVGQVYGTCWLASSSDVTSCVGGHPVSLPDSCPKAITKSTLKKKKERVKEIKEGREKNTRAVAIPPMTSWY